MSSHSNQSEPGGMHRLHTHDLELGTTDVLTKHMTRHVIERKPVSQARLRFEHARPRWLREMIAESVGVFVYGEQIARPSGSKCNEA